LKLSLSSLGIILALLLVIIVGGWSAFWFYAAHETEGLIASWISREASVGRNWTCLDRHVGGYPFDIEIGCSNASFSGLVFGKQLAGTNLKGFRATASLFQPDQIAASINSPFAVKGGAGEGEMTLRWSEMTLLLSGQPDALATLVIDGKDVELSGNVQGVGSLDGNAASFRNVIAAIPERRAEDAYSFSLALNQAVIPAVDFYLGTAGAENVKIDAVVTRADFRLAGTMGERFEQWRQSGGQIEVKDARLTRDATLVAGQGLLRLDAQHRPEGELNAQFAGVEPVLKRFGVNPALIGAGSLLSSLLGGGKPKPQADGAPTLKLPVVLNGGFISIGPVRTSLALPVLY